MKTKEAIENIEDTYDCHSNDRAYCKEDRERIEKEKNNIIELLQRGENFEEKFLEIFNENKKLWQMWEELKKDSYGCEAWWSKYGLMRYEQKYFPKPSDNFTEKVMEKINKEADNETKIQ